MKISVQDLQTLVAWLGKHSPDTSIRVKLEQGYMTVLATDGARQLVDIRIFDADSSKKATRTVQEYLEQGLKP